MVELAVVIPTFNERQNVQPMIRALAEALAGIDYELIFVDDDSPDGTSREVREALRENSRIRLLHRIHRRGLSSAVVEGMMASAAPYVAVIDGDMQHDETALPEMLRRLKSGGVDLVIGTRHRYGGSVGEFPRVRLALSQFGRRLSARVCRADVSDPMSGFFCLSRDYLEKIVRRLSCVGYKILVDILASSEHPVRVQEVGYTFRKRIYGQSKLDLLVGLEYLELVLDKLVGQWIPVRYALFGMAGALGVLAQLAAIGLLLRFRLFAFDAAQLISSLMVIVLNYEIDNQIAFRDCRLRGWQSVYGLALFACFCSLGLYLNLRIARGLVDGGVPWLLASLAGISIASVWNYSLSALLVWRINRRR